MEVVALPKEHFQEETHQCVSVPIPLDKALRHGWMLKKTRKDRWHRRYFVLFRHTLAWYKTDGKDELAQGALTLADSTITSSGEAIEILSPLAYLMRTEKETARGRAFLVKCADRGEQESWHQLLVQQNTHTGAKSAWPKAHDSEWVL